MIRPLKKFSYYHCLQLKELGYSYFGTDFCERPNENCLVLYPFKNQSAATKFSKTDPYLDPLVLEINDELKDLPDQISEIKIYVQYM